MFSHEQIKTANTYGLTGIKVQKFIGKENQVIYFYSVQRRYLTNWFSILIVGKSYDLTVRVLQKQQHASARLLNFDA